MLAQPSNQIKPSMFLAVPSPSDSSTPPELPIPMMQGWGTSLCGVPPKELTEEKLRQEQTNDDKKNQCSQQNQDEDANMDSSS